MTQLWARTVGARLGQRAVYSWKVQVPQTWGLERWTLVSSTKPPLHYWYPAFKFEPQYRGVQSPQASRHGSSRNPAPLIIVDHQPAAGNQPAKSHPFSRTNRFVRDVRVSPNLRIEGACWVNHGSVDHAVFSSSNGSVIVPVVFPGKNEVHLVDCQNPASPIAR